MSLNIDKEQGNDTTAHRRASRDPKYCQNNKLKIQVHVAKLAGTLNVAKNERQPTTAHQRACRDPEYLKKEQAADTIAHQKTRMDPEYHQKQKAKDTDICQRTRKDPECRQKEQQPTQLPVEGLVVIRRKENRNVHCRIDKTRKSQAWLSSDSRRLEKTRKLQNITRTTLTTSDLISEFHRKVAQGPLHICCSCQLFC